jgi:hypothetical protein
VGLKVALGLGVMVKVELSPKSRLLAGAALEADEPEKIVRVADQAGAQSDRARNIKRTCFKLRKLVKVKCPPGPFPLLRLRLGSPRTGIVL